MSHVIWFVRSRSMNLFFIIYIVPIFSFFFFNDTATTEIYTLSLHDALPIWEMAVPVKARNHMPVQVRHHVAQRRQRSEEHTSELQSPDHLVCRLLLEKKKKHKKINHYQAPGKA